MQRVAGRMRAKPQAMVFEGDEARIRLAGEKPIDPRALVYFERSDAFGPARLVASADEGRTMDIVAPLKRLWLPLGADVNGRDLAARLMLAGRVSLLVGVLGSAVALGVGVAYGMVAGYAGGRIDFAMMRVVDALYALPFIFFVILLTAFFGRQFVLIFIAIGAVEWLDMARIARGQTLSLKTREYVLAARALGVAPGTILAPAHRAQHRRRSAGLSRGARPARHSGRELPVLPRARRARAVDQRRRAGGGWRAAPAGRPLAARRARDPAAAAALRPRPRRRERRRPAVAGAEVEQALFVIDNLRVDYHGAAAVSGASLRVDAGEVVALVGESGSGKTQTLHAALGLLGRDARIGGSARFRGQELIGAPRAALDKLRGDRIALVFQEPMTALDPLTRVGAQIAAPILAHGGADARARSQPCWIKSASPAARARARDYPHQLSGGERQRVLIAMALSNRPDLLIADEPTTALDATVQKRILDGLEERRRALGLAMILVTHDLRLARRYASPPLCDAGRAHRRGRADGGCVRGAARALHPQPPRRRTRADAPRQPRRSRRRRWPAAA